MLSCFPLGYKEPTQSLRQSGTPDPVGQVHFQLDQSQWLCLSGCVAVSVSLFNTAHFPFVSCLLRTGMHALLPNPARMYWPLCGPSVLPTLPALMWEPLQGGSTGGPSGQCSCTG